MTAQQELTNSQTVIFAKKTFLQKDHQQQHKHIMVNTAWKENTSETYLRARSWRWTSSELMILAKSVLTILGRGKLK